MVRHGSLMVLAATLTMGCSILNAGSTHTAAFDGGSDVDAPLSPPRLRLGHLSRDSGPIDVYANGDLILGDLVFPSVTAPNDVPEGEVTFLVTRAGTTEMLAQEMFEAEPGRSYTLTFFGDANDPPVFEGEAARTLGLLLLDDDASGLDRVRDIRLAAIHVASPVVAGQLVNVTDAGNVGLVDDFAFQAVAVLRMLPSMGYRVGFDAGANGTVDLTFDLPNLAPGTYANVFVAARTDDSVFLLVSTTTNRGEALVIDPN